MPGTGLKNPNSKQFRKIIEKNDLQKIYLFLGEEAAEKEKFIKLIADKFFKQQEQQVGRFHSEIEDLKNAARYVLEESIFFSKKICVLLDIDEIKTTDKEKSGLLKDIFYNIPDSSILILIAGTNKVPAVISKNDLQNIQPVQFWKLFDSELESYIINTLQKYNKKIEHPAVIKILQLLGRDMGKIDHALGLLINLDTDTISSEAISTLIENECSIKIFDFIDLLFNKNRAALDLLKKLFDENMPELVVLAFIKNQAEKIELYHSLVNGGHSGQQALQQLKVPAPGAQKFIKQAAFFNEHSIKKIFPLIYKTDYALKNKRYSSSIISNPLFEMVTDIIFT